MSIRNLLRTTRSNYGLQLASLLYRLTSVRRYSTNTDNSSEAQANNIQTNVNDSNESPSMNARSNSFANRRRVIRDGVENQTPSQTIDQKSVPLPSSMLRNWEKSPKKLQLNIWKGGLKDYYFF
jgi:hypothetical protein